MTLKQINMTQICCQAQCEFSLQKSKKYDFDIIGMYL